MGKTIDADALWKSIIGKYDSVLGLGDLMEELVNAPAAEPRKGKWMPNPDDTAGCGYFACSACGVDVYSTSDYCPNCGARMEESE